MEMIMVPIGSSPLPLTPALASGVYDLSYFNPRSLLIKDILITLSCENRLDQLAGVNIKALAAGVASEIPLPEICGVSHLLTTDHDEIANKLRSAPRKRLQRGEAIFEAAMDLYAAFGAMPLGFQQVLDAYLVHKGLLAPFRPKYL